ncbi:MAG TPA: sporulation protein YqfD [Sedimentibacter sp.]|nr:sporulation protein YqfD [Sedimentibacter sp.]HPW99711.1 sporulation protein YqfD [Sedimentibacter sp.]HQB64138.1 sporulation protein YqfD [Sedimentibacter sp.]
MLIFKLMYLIRGYVVIRRDDMNSEKLLNILRRRNISVWDVEKKDKKIKFKISYEDYIKHSDLINEIVKPESKRGVLLKLNKLKLRRGFSIGLLILIISLYLLTSMIWDVEVIGTNQPNTNEIIRLLEKNKIKLPFALSQIETKKLETLIYDNFQFKFVEVFVEGSKLIIFVREREPEPAEIKSNEPSSIIALKNAIVNKVIAKSGQAVVKEGDVVYEGQTLIMGIVKNKNSEEFMMVPSEGTVYGKTYYNFEMKEEKIRNVNVSTNKSNAVYYLIINGNSIKIIGDKDPYENYNYREREINVPLVSNIADISILKGVYYEEVIKKIEIDKETAHNKMKVSMYDELLKSCDEDSRILKSNINFSEDEEFYYLIAQIEVIEDIGEKIRIYPTAKEKTEENMEE